MEQPLNLGQMGIWQVRYFGRVKTKRQLYLPAAVANLTRLATGSMRSAILLTTITT